MQESTEPALHERLEKIIALAEQLRATEVWDRDGYEAALVAADRLCDHAIAVRWWLLQDARRGSGRPSKPPVAQRSAQVRRLLEGKGFRIRPNPSQTSPETGDEDGDASR
ncbi:hypothetical protein GQ464_002545 [Rhodocaloribacter litoris]|uniref:hypothetical protein n=1 Tax=Rhodocaloribacter litoris TaxID=2558931 RepID=UPI00141F67FD|nr:hypothetical protein [Rhodocaloribacter litoris]QXD15847.1 hypothetical protein GQ464_002545 [Rhodocaloribacter litoris]GIV57111.1 MAG: hypothetical protein KatS3mg042_0024 [Rhodothermaceae bacterium]